MTPTPNIQELLDRVDRALEGVTEEPWESDSYVGLPYDTFFVETKKWRLRFPEPDTGSELCDYMCDSKFIAAARSLVPELTQALKEAQDDERVLRHTINAMRRENETLRKRLAAAELVCDRVGVLIKGWELRHPDEVQSGLDPRYKPLAQPGLSELYRTWRKLKEGGSE